MYAPTKAVPTSAPTAVTIPMSTAVPNIALTTSGATPRQRSTPRSQPPGTNSRPASESPYFFTFARLGGFSEGALLMTLNLQQAAPSRPSDARWRYGHVRRTSRIEHCMPTRELEELAGALAGSAAP